MHNSYNQLYSTVFCLLYMFRTNLVVHQQEHGIIYCTTHYNRYNRAGESSQTRLHDCTDCTKLCNTVYYAVLLMMNDQFRSKHVQQTKNCGIKIDYKNCASRWSLTHVLCISTFLLIIISHCVLAHYMPIPLFLTEHSVLL